MINTVAEARDRPGQRSDERVLAATGAGFTNASAIEQRSGTEWLFRFVDDPRRLPRLGGYLRFAWLLCRGKL